MCVGTSWRGFFETTRLDSIRNPEFDEGSDEICGFDRTLGLAEEKRTKILYFWIFLKPACKLDGLHLACTSLGYCV